MQGKDRTKKQLIDELLKLRKRVAELEASETKRREVEKALQESEKRFEQIAESSGEFIWEVNVNGLYTYANPVIEEILGYKPEELIGKKHFYDFFAPHVKDALKNTAFEVFAKKEVFRNFINPNIHKNGNIVILETSGSPVIDDKGNLLGYRGSDRDITERKKAEEALHESETKFRRLTEAAFGGIAVTEKGKFIDVSDQFAVLFGYQQSELIGIYAADLIAPEVRDEAIDKILSGYDKPYESLCLRKDGSTFPVEVCGKNYYSQGRELRVTAIRDITERKLTEETLQESEDKYKTLTENSLTGIFIHQDGRFIFVNDRFAEIHGYKTEELLGKDHLALIHPDERGTLRDIASKRLKGEIVPQRYEVRRIRKNSETIWCEMMATRIQYRGRPAIMGNIIDITERKKAEEALKERERELEIKTNNLEEANIALKVLLKRREEDKTELEEKVLLNIKELVVPYFEKLKTTGLDEKQNTYVNILESNLNDITSSFSVRLSSRYLNFTPTEIQVANLIGQGKESKEIAELLNSSPRTIAFHRERIRKKLGLRNKKTNLKTYLMSSL